MSRRASAPLGGGGKAVGAEGATQRTGGAAPGVEPHAHAQKKSAASEKGAEGAPLRRDGERPPSHEPGLHPALSTSWAILETGPLAEPAPGGSARERAEVMALAERMLVSMRRERGRGSEQRLALRLAGDGRPDLHVRLDWDGAQLSAHIESEDGDRRRASRLGERLERALRARGLDLAGVEVG